MSVNACLQQLTLLGRNSASRNSRGLIGLVHVCNGELKEIHSFYYPQVSVQQLAFGSEE
jgi:hypothetical protein